MIYSDNFIQALKDRNDISDVVSGYVSLKRKGKNMSGLCPFHSEKTPSFFVYPGNGSFYCFGCGVGGDVITFIKLIEKYDYIEAVKYLADRVGMELPQGGQDSGDLHKKLKIYEINRELAKFYHNFLTGKDGKKALKYLIGRGLSLKTIRHFGLGYSPESGFEGVNYLRNKGYKDQELKMANVAYFSAKGNPYDRFRGRVMFPIIDLRGNVIAFGGRTISEEMPKYLNTSDTLVFKKSENIFALNFAKNKAGKNFILAEGYMDVISLHQAGFENAVATLGTALTQSQARLMSRFSDEVIISYDSDEAGKKASDRAIKICRESGLDVKILRIPKGKDPDEFMKSFGEEGKARFKNLIENSEGDVEYRLDRLKEGYDLDKPEDRVKYLNSCVNILCGLTNFIECEIYASKLSESLGIEKKSILMQVERVKKRKNKEREKRNFKEIEKSISKNMVTFQEKDVSLRAMSAEELFLSCIINNLDMVNNISEKVKPDIFLSELNRRIYEKICNLNKEGRNIDITTLSSEGFDEKEVGYIAKLLCCYVPSEDIKRDIYEYISVIKEEKELDIIKKCEDIDKNEAMKYIEMLREKKK